MEPIKRGLNFQVKQAAIEGGGDGTSMLDMGDIESKLLEINPDEETVPLDQKGEQDIATNFDHDADKPEKESITEEAAKDASETLLSDENK